MSKKAEQLLRQLNRLIKRELAKGTTEHEIVGALEIAKGQMVIATVSVNTSLQPKPPNKNN